MELSATEDIIQNAFDWDEIKREIPEASDPEGPVELIRLSLDANDEGNPNEKINQRLDRLLKQLNEELKEATKHE